MSITDSIFLSYHDNANRLSPVTSYDRTIAISGCLLITVALSFLLINFFYFHYVGNNYFPKHSFGVGIILLTILAGAYFQFNQKHMTFLITKEVGFFYLTFVGIALLTNAVQFTPFDPIDQVIIELERKWGIDLIQIMAWTHRHPTFKKILFFAYASLEYQMTLLPLFIILTLNFKKMRSYYFLLIISALIGFSFYYFFPTTAPASNLSSPFFAAEQYATGIKFKEIHHHMPPSSSEGGMIALPSFHVIWAWLCLYLAYEQRWLFLLLLPNNCLLILSCVLLGWHYPTDILGAACIIMVSHWLQHKLLLRLGE